MMELKITKTKLKNFQEFNIRFEETEEKKISSLSFILKYEGLFD